MKDFFFKKKAWTNFIIKIIAKSSLVPCLYAYVYFCPQISNLSMMFSSKVPIHTMSFINEN
jgi:hypothetical protein